MVFSKHCYKPTFLSCSELSRSVDLLMTISLSLTSCSRTATLVVSWWMSFSFSWYSPSREEFCFLSPCSSCLTRMCSSSRVESLDLSSRIEDSDLYFLSVKSCQINTPKNNNKAPFQSENTINCRLLIMKHSLLLNVFLINIIKTELLHLYMNHRYMYAHKVNNYCLCSEAIHFH